MPLLLRLCAALLIAALAALPARAGPNDTAVIIANKAYDHSHEVEFAHNDGERFADAARRALAVPPSRVHVHRDLTGGAMRALFGRPENPGRIAGLVNRDTKRLWVYYSGHGFPDRASGKRTPYLLPRDGDPAALEYTGVALGDVRAALAALKKQMAGDAEVILIVEACFSSLSSKGPVQPKVSGSAFHPDLEGDAAVIVIAAAGDDHVASWDHQAKLGLFTDVLLDVLFARAGRTADGKVTLGHLKAHIERELQSRLARLYPGETRRQRPWISREAPSIVLTSFSGEPPPRDADETPIAETIAV
ncbi:MAG TPA: caspase family protein, partial [Hyphomicrobiaceae bacterium]|nr:caspase family protein [Hyphomicrobiaceae bacterium]